MSLTNTTYNGIVNLRDYSFLAYSLSTPQDFQSFDNKIYNNSLQLHTLYEVIIKR